MSNTAQPTLETLLSHAAFVRGLARALLRGDRHVDDVVQETWLAAVSGGPDRPGQERAWLSRVVRNVAYGTLRREGRRARRETAAASPVTVPGTHEIAAREETRRKLLEHVLAVAEPSRSALLLRYYEGLAPRDVARSLGVPVETARTRIKRGLIELRGVLDAEHDGSRRAWMSALAPLAGWALPVAGATAAASGSLLAWGLILLMGLGASLVLSGGGGAVLAPGLGSPEGPAPRLIARGWRRSEDTGPVEVGRARIYGRVLRDGRGLSARVWISPGTAVPRGEPKRTDAEGRFAYDGLAETHYALRVETDDGVVMRSDVHLLAKGQHLRRDFDVPAAGNTVRGEVTWRSGKAFEGEVRFRLPTRAPWGARAEGSWLSAACEGGRFVLAGLPAGPLALGFLVPGGPSIGRTVSPPAAGETLRIVVDEGLRTWQGTVVDEKGKPLPGVGFGGAFYRPDLSVRYKGGLTSGSRGQLAFLRPADGQGSAWCTTPGYLRPHVWTPESETILLLAGGRLHGVVRGPGGDPVGAGVQVRAVSTGTSTGREGIFHRPVHTVDASTTVTDADGSYEVSLLPGRAFAYAAGKGLASPGVGALRQDAAVAFAKDLAPGENLEVDLDLEPSASLQGRVLDGQSQPVVGALIYLLREPSARSGHRGARILPAYTASDADGRFRLDVHPGFEVRARARHPEFVASKSAAFSLEGGTEVAITLRMERPRRVRFRVVDAESGEPIVGAAVAVSRAKTWPWEFEMNHESATSDDHGVAEHWCAPGGLGYRVRADGFETDSNWKPLEASIEPGPLDVRVTLQRGLRVAGRVLLADGLPALEARVVLEPIAGTGGSWSPTGQRVDAEGRFTIVDRRRGTYRLSAWINRGGQRHRAERVVTESNEAVELVLQPHGRQKGEWCVHVRDADGQPAAASVALYWSQLAGHGGQFGRGEHTVDGVAYVHGAGGKRFFLVVTPSVGSGSGTELLGPFSSWEGGEYEVTLSPGRVVEGVVRNAAGAAATSLRLTAVPATGDTDARVPLAVSRVARTDAEGRFTLRGIGRHPVQIRFQTQADGWTPPSIALDPDDDHPQLILAGHHEAVSVRVLAPDGNPAVRGRIDVFPATGPVKAIAQATTGGDGVAQLQGLDPSQTYRLLVAGDWASHLAPHVDAAWSPADATIRLETALRTSGDVRTASGRVAGRARVWRRGAFGRWRMVQEHPRMPFELYLARGRHELVALTMDERPDAQAAGTWIQAGAADIVLPFQPGPTLWMRVAPWTEGRFGSLEIQREGEPLKRALSARIARDGRSERYRLEAEARYSVFARLGEDVDHPDAYVYATGLRTSEDEAALAVKTGHVLEGRIVGGAKQAKDGLVLFVHVGLHRVWVRVQPDGGFRATGLPPGEVRVEVRTGPGPDATTSSFRCRPGVFASLRLD